MAYWLVLSAISAWQVAASLQGLYAVQLPKGQLVRVDWSTGTLTNIGGPLADAGWFVDSCAPATVHPTYKLYLTLGRSKPGSSTEPWHLLRISLGDGSVQSAQPLPASFSPSLGSCEHAFSMGRGFNVLISAVTGVGASQELTLAALDFQHDAEKGLASISLESIGLGRPVAFPATVYSAVGETTTVWQMLERGLAGVNVSSGAVDVTVPVPEKSIFVPAEFMPRDQKVYGLLHQDGSRVAWFDPLSNSPTLQVCAATVPDAAKAGTAVTLLWEEQQLAILANTSLITVDLEGHVIGSVQVCDKEPTPGMGCFASMAYQPNVIEAIL